MSKVAIAFLKIVAFVALNRQKFFYPLIYCKTCDIIKKDSVCFFESKLFLQKNRKVKPK